MNPKEPGRNGIYQNGAPGVTEIDPEQGNPFAEPPFISDDEQAQTDADDRQETPKRKSKRVVGVILVLLLLGAGGAGYWIVSGGRKTKITVPVRDNARKTDQASANNNDEVTAQAIAEVRGATATPTPAISVVGATGAGVNGATGATGATGTAGATKTVIVPTTPVTIPVEGVGGTVRPSTTEATAGQSGGPSVSLGSGKRAEVVPRRNTEQSIRCAPTPTPVPNRQPLTSTTAKQPVLEPALLKRTEPPIVLPPFGSLLPVRTLGAIFTLRQGLARFELTRDVRGDNWQLKKGTILVGQQQGNESDRAYINLVGFIDPPSGKLVRLSGDMLGADGAPGLKGKLHKVSATWKRVLDRVARDGVTLGTAALSRGNNTTIVLPSAAAPELTSFTASSRREFVEVKAGSPAYVMVTRLPEQAQGIDAQPSPPPPEASIASAGGAGVKTLSDEELAALIESGTPEQVRAAMPRMSPELRQIAEMVLKER